MNVVLHIEPRWTDLDAQGHVNNSVYLVYAEEARGRLMRSVLGDTWHKVVVVHNSIDYHHPVEITDTVEVTSALEKIGSSSMTSISVIATAEGQRCATVRTVQVVLNEDGDGSRPWTDEERATLEGVIGSGTS